MAGRPVPDWSHARRTTPDQRPSASRPTGGDQRAVTSMRRPLVAARAGAPTSGRRPPLRGCSIFAWLPPPFSSFFSHFWALWSMPSHWLQYMPSLPKLLLKTSNTHNFCSVGPKIMKFVLLRSLL
jgi:hypothetical protein